MRRRVVLALVLVAVVAAAGVAAALVADGDGADAGDEEPAAAASTEEAVRTDLIEETSYDGTLGRPASDPIVARAEGTITATPEPGDTVGNGQVAYEVDGEPVIALIGDIPAFRDLTPYPDTVDLLAAVDGVVTWLPGAGDVIEAGDVVMEIDGEPVIALAGDVPPYRDLADLPDDMTGDDVLQLEENLAEFGLADTFDVTVDGEFTSATEDAVEALQEWLGMDDDGSLEVGEYVVIDGPTEVVEPIADIGDTVGQGGEPVLRLADGDRLAGADVAQLDTALAELGHLDEPNDVFDAETATAVRALQDDLGLEVDGELAADEVVFLPSPVQVASVATPVGSVVSPGTTVLEVTGEDTTVTFDLPADQQGTIEEGQPVTVELPNYSLVDATVTSVATVATAIDAGPVFEIEVTIADPDAVAGLDEAPVEVLVVTDSAVDVVAVPVPALIALRDGGYAVEVVRGATTELVAVEPGFFAAGMVEIDGDVVPGDQVVVP